MNRHKGRFLWWRNLSACLLLCSSSSVFAASVDIYEEDNTYDKATACIEIGATNKQSHTIHAIDDEDWICFKTQPKWTYKIVLDNVGNDIDVVLEVYDTDGKTGLERKNRGFDGENEDVDFTPSEGGTYYVKVTHTGFFIDDTKYDIHITGVEPANTPPKAQFTIKDAQGEEITEGKEITEGDTLSLDGSTSSDPDGDSISYTWSAVADGNSVTGFVQDAEDISKSTITFDKPGSYTISLVVTDNEDAKSTNNVSQTVTVSEKPNQAPVASFEVEPNSGIAPLTVSLNASGSSDDGEIKSYSYTYTHTTLDGEEKEPVEISLTEETKEIPNLIAGTYTISLVVTDDKGVDSKNVVNETVTVSEPNQPPVANFTIRWDEEATDKVIIDAESSSDSDPDDSISSYTWTIGEEEQTETGKELSFQVSTTSTYTPGTYTISLIVKDNNEAESEPFEKVVNIGIPSQLMTTRGGNQSLEPGKKSKLIFQLTDDLDKPLENVELDFVLNNLNGSLTDEKLIDIDSEEKTEGKQSDNAITLTTSTDKNGQTSVQFTAPTDVDEDIVIYELSAKVVVDDATPDVVEEFTNIFVLLSSASLEWQKPENISGNIIPDSMSTNATFSSGIYDQSFTKKDGELSPEDDVLILGSIQVDSNHVDEKNVDIVVAVYDKNATSLSYLFLDSHNKFNAQLVPFRRGATLGETQFVKIWKGAIPVPNTSWGILFGYHLKDGTIVYSSAPIVVTIGKSSNVDNDNAAQD